MQGQARTEHWLLLLLRLWVPRRPSHGRGDRATKGFPVDDQLQRWPREALASVSPTSRSSTPPNPKSETCEAKSDGRGAQHEGRFVRYARVVRASPRVSELDLEGIPRWTHGQAR